MDDGKSRGKRGERRAKKHLTPALSPERRGRGDGRGNKHLTPARSSFIFAETSSAAPERRGSRGITLSRNTGGRHPLLSLLTSAPTKRFIERGVRHFAVFPILDDGLNRPGGC